MTDLDTTELLPTKFEPILRNRFILSFDNLDIPSYLVKSVRLSELRKDSINQVEVIVMDMQGLNLLYKVGSPIVLGTPITFSIKFLNCEGVVIRKTVYSDSILMSCLGKTLSYKKKKSSNQLMTYSLLFNTPNIQLD